MLASEVRFYIEHQGSSIKDQIKKIIYVRLPAVDDFGWRIRVQKHEVTT